MDAGYRMMIWTYWISDLFKDPAEKLNGMDIGKPKIIVDYGCGPGRYLKHLSEIVGKRGTVHAVDIHPMAIEYSERRIRKFGLENVRTHLADGYRSGIPSGSSDLVLALDMFHRVDDPTAFLKELKRILRDGGRIILEYEHQSPGDVYRTVKNTGVFRKIRKEQKYLMLEK
jgi:ubiquinone/menaquinone biosynthesis C-methylase UbiE